MRSRSTMWAGRVRRELGDPIPGCRHPNPCLSVPRAHASRSHAASLSRPQRSVRESRSDIYRANQSLNDDRLLAFAVGSDGGRFEQQFSDPGGAQVQYRWVGPEQTAARAHGLVWQNNATTDAPEAYYAYGTTPLSVDSTITDHVLFSLALAPTTIASGLLTGTGVPANTGTDRTNTVSLRFDSGATIRLANISSPGNNFSYLVHTIANASVSIAAVEGCGQQTETCSIAHRDGLSSGGAATTLTIPKPITMLTVASASAVDEQSAFSFISGVGAATVSIFDNTLGNDRLYLITNKHSFTIPRLINGTYSLEAGATYSWTVTTHGTPASVDDMAGASGFIDSYGFYTVDLEPTGSRAGDGSYTASAAKSFTVAK